MSSTHWGSGAITGRKCSSTWEPGLGVLRLSSLRDDPGVYSRRDGLAFDIGFGLPSLAAANFSLEAQTRLITQNKRVNYFERGLESDNIREV